MSLPPVAAATPQADKGAIKGGKIRSGPGSGLGGGFVPTPGTAWPPDSIGTANINVNGNTSLSGAWSTGQRRNSHESSQDLDNLFISPVARINTHVNSHSSKT